MKHVIFRNLDTSKCISASAFIINPTKAIYLSHETKVLKGQITATTKGLDFCNSRMIFF